MFAYAGCHGARLPTPFSFIAPLISSKIAGSSMVAGVFQGLWQYS
jgi:hypothetical protein